MPPRKPSLLLVAPLALALLLIASSALAADPPSTPAVIKSATFDAGVAPFAVGEIKSERPSLAYWGPITNVRRGTSGQSLWCAGTRQFPSIYAPSGFFPSYPYWGQLVKRTAEPVTLKSTTPVRLTYQGFAGSKVSSIVVKSSTGTIYKADTDYVAALDAQGYTTIARKNTVISSGATVYVDYYWPTSGTRGIATLDLPELAHYYRSWLSLYYLMPSLGAGDTDSFSFNWVDASAPSSTDSHYGFDKVSGWTRIERELSAGQSVPLSRRPGQLRVQFFEFTDGTGTRNGQGAAIDDVVVTGYKYGPVRDLVAARTGSRVELSWSKPARTPSDASDDERDVAYRVWRSPAGANKWTEVTTARVTDASFSHVTTDGSAADYAVQAWDPSGAAQYGEVVTTSIPVAQTSTIEVQHDAAGVTFDRWVTGYSTAYSGGGYVYGRWTGTRLDAKFTGTNIAWIGPKQPAYGMADIYIDGALVASDVDCYAPAGSANIDSLIWKSSMLSQGAHTISIRLTGTKNPASTGTVVVLDRFEVAGAPPHGGGVRLDDSTATPGYSGSWISAINPTYFNKTYAYSRWTNAAFTATFEGTKVAWIGPRTPNFGIADVYIDDVKVATVDTYRANLAAQGWREVVWESGTLSPGNHTIAIKPTGTANPSATAANVVIDAIDVTP